MAGKRALQRLRENRDLLQSDIQDDHNHMNSLGAELESISKKSQRSSPNKLLERLQLDNELLTKTVDDLQARLVDSSSRNLPSNYSENSKLARVGAEIETLKSKNRNLEENLAALLVRNQI